MIHGIGTDIVEVARVAAALERHGRRFAERVLAETELPDFDVHKSPAHFLAKRFAAKEAGAKALGTGFTEGVTLQQIRVSRDRRGRPLLEFSGRAAELCNEFGVVAAHLSLADERDYAVAFVTLVGTTST